MPLQLQRWTPSLIVPKEWIGCPKSWWEREAHPNESIIDHTKQSWYFSNASSALTLDAELNRSINFNFIVIVLDERTKIQNITKYNTERLSSAANVRAEVALLEYQLCLV
ncbi:Hypothetical_protein [Hexamita inflata]|uniref:Hypothetical_protein n=1 Tax=Hexamita inflata TaxID=28002 RepID=A0AA86QPY0_9EUKA|nr:Hypothetical protein HINF_LOCUS45608 [Hexamita inflata]